MDTNEVRLLTIPAAAKLLSLSTRSLWRMVSTEGALPGVVRLAGRSVRVDRRTFAYSGRERWVNPA